MTEPLPDHWLQLIELARATGAYPASAGTNGQTWCDEMVGMGLMEKRGVFYLDRAQPYTEHTGKWPELHMYGTTVEGRRLIGKPYANDPETPQIGTKYEPIY